MTKVTKQEITHEKGNKDAWICECGNTPSDDGFYPCNIFGYEVEPTEKEWNGKLYVCNQCKRIINQFTLEVVNE